MAEILTERQRQAVEDRGGKLLVSAAAGSGKTKVLVDRLLRYIMDPVNPANVDDFLIITYTKAAAAELRGKIAQKLGERIAELPENKHLQKQIHRLYLAKISTVHSFCTDLLRENAYRMDIPADFRVGDENECKQLQEMAMTQLLESAYLDIDQNEEIRQLINTQGLGRDDRQIPKIILKVYHSAKCHLDPDGWLDWCTSHMQLDNVVDASETVWGKYLINRLHSCLDGHIAALNKCVVLADQNNSMVKPATLLHSTIDQLISLRKCITWEQIHGHAPIEFGTLSFGSKCSDLALAEQIKKIRKSCKDDLAKIIKWFADSNDQVLQDLAESAVPTRGLIQLVRRFAENYDNLKKRRRLLDFADLEHNTLDLLTGKRRDRITTIAKEYGERFREVMVDEYQDSNAVQDAIFSALTDRRQNCFMVGDVKQSIYQFRLADPGIFIDKYDHYLPADIAEPGQGRKVLLTDNFRSGSGVISAVNDVFSLCMSKKVGGLDYGTDEMLYEGIKHEKLPDPEIELYTLCSDEDAYVTEANFVAKRIVELLDGKHMVRDKEGIRAVTPGDVVILLRSPNSVGGDFLEVLNAHGIRCTMGDSDDVLKTEEVSTLISLLQTIQNPLVDIPLIATLSSRLFGFTADDLAQIRKQSKHTSFYHALCESSHNKAQAFIRVLEDLRSAARVCRLGELLQKIVEFTDIFSVFGAFPDGQVRCSNIQTFYSYVCSFGSGGQRDLTQLLEHMENAQDKGISINSDPGGGDIVRIMSIHKSKGLEFPVVFLCGLSRKFNLESAYGQVLCDKELGLGLNVVDSRQRVRYPNIAKRAISASIVEQSVSEEMRVLYVAMTRAKDRLIMTYTKKNLADNLQELGLRMELTPSEVLTADANCSGKWILQAAMNRAESGQLRKFADLATTASVYSTTWKIEVVEQVVETDVFETEDDMVSENISDSTLNQLLSALHYQYPFETATSIPSKLTATQLKGRSKDHEIAEHTRNVVNSGFVFRQPSFVKKKTGAAEKGTAVHSFLQYADLNRCRSVEAVAEEARRLVSMGLLTQDQEALLDHRKIVRCICSELGSLITSSENVLREFKFSVLVDAGEYYPEVCGERILLQGVVDCAIIDSDGITVIDFKTDRVFETPVATLAQNYVGQVNAYAKALEKIYKLPVIKKFLYFFDSGESVQI